MSLSSELAGAMEEHDLKFGEKYFPKPKIATKEENDISITQRMISACSGSLITSLVVTPFDVIRIRIQQQEILPQDTCCQSSYQASNIPYTGKNTLVKNMSTPPVVTAEGSPELFWMHNRYCRAENCSRITSTFQGFACVCKNEGIATLWRGLSLTLIMAIPSNIIYFTGYEYIRDHSPISNHPLNPLLCGAVARIMSATCIAPAELIKTRLQSIPSDSHNSKVLSNLLKDSFGLVRQNGLGTLFKGLQITLWRDVPFSGIYWSCYELFKSRIGYVLNADFDNISKKNEWKLFTTSFLSGSISGTVAAFFTNPFDVGKTRLQITFEEGKKPGGYNRNMFKFLINIYRREGIGALYAGFGPRVMKIAPACAIMISSYEIGKKFFKNGNNHN